MRLITALFTTVLLMGTASGAPAEKKGAAQKVKKTEKAQAGAEQKAGSANKAAQAIAGRCQAKLPNGERCAAKADAGGRYCSQHTKMMTKEAAASPKKTTKR